MAPFLAPNPGSELIQETSQTAAHIQAPPEVFELVSNEQLLKTMQSHVRSVAYSMCRSYRLCPSYRDDLAIEMQMDLIKVDQRRRRQTMFLRVVANNAARNALAKILRSNYREPVGLMAIDNRSITEKPRETVESRIWVEEALAGLTPSERTILTHYLGLDGEKAIKSFRRLGQLVGEGCGEEQAKKELGGALSKVKRFAAVTKT